MASMTLEQKISAIQKQINEVEPILNKLSCLRVAPSRPYGAMPGVKRYDKISRGKIEEEINTWQYATKTVLYTCFGSNHEHTRTFEHTIVQNRAFFDAKEELEGEVKDGRNALVSIIKAETTAASLMTPVIISPRNETYPETTMSNQAPKVFISHSSDDKHVIDSFVDNVLILGLGLGKDNIFFTSNEVYGVKPGDDISRYIKENIEASEVVLLMISSTYRESEVCLNEMGASWALGKPFIPILLPDTDFDKLGWLINLHKAIRINQKEQVVSLCEKMVKLLKIGNIEGRLTAIVTYTDKFIGDLSSAPVSIVPKVAKTLQIGNIDSEVHRAISKLGEFTIKELQEETKIQNYHYLMNIVNAMVIHGELEALVDRESRKYRIK